MNLRRAHTVGVAEPEPPVEAMAKGFVGLLLSALVFGVAGCGKLSRTPASNSPNTGASVSAANTAPANAVNSASTLAGADSADAYALAKIAAANFIVLHPNASHAEALAVATAAARQSGDPDPATTGDGAASDAEGWIADRKANGFPPQTTPAELAANDAAADTAERSLDHANAVPEAPSRGPHYFPKVGACFETAVASIATRLQDTAGSGDEVEYTDGHHQVSYDTSRVVQRFRVGDPIRLCVTDLPGHCPSTDDRGVTFVAINGRTGGRWRASDSEHQCGGA